MRILFLDLDTLRPDHLGCYGYKRNTSPTLDAIAKEGVRFENYFCSDAPCLPSRHALMSGRFGINTGAVGHGDTCADPFPQGKGRDFTSDYARNCLPKVLTDKGFRTASISSFADRHSSHWFLAGFNETMNYGFSKGDEIASQVTEHALDWLERNGKKDNWFLHLNYWDAHTPYRAPAEFGNPFENEPLDTYMTDKIIREHNKSAGPHGSLEIAMFDNHRPPHWPRHPGEVKNLQEYKYFIDQYDCGIRYMDDEIAKVIDFLKTNGLYNDDLCIIISADHGENMSELNSYAEHGTADYFTCRIPMIIKWKGTKAGVDTGYHVNTDLIATLADILGRQPFAKWDGVSFADVLRNEPHKGRDYIVLSQMAHVCQRSVLKDNWLYMRTFHDGYRLILEDEMLFDLNTDPYEQFNIAKEQPKKLKELSGILDNWTKENLAKNGGIDPKDIVMKEGGPFHANGHLKRYCAYLEKTGRADCATKLRARHPNEPM